MCSRTFLVLRKFWISLHNLRDINAKFLAEHFLFNQIRFGFCCRAFHVLDNILAVLSIGKISLVNYRLYSFALSCCVALQQYEVGLLAKVWYSCYYAVEKARRIMKPFAKTVVSDRGFNLCQNQIPAFRAYPLAGNEPSELPRQSGAFQKWPAYPLPNQAGSVKSVGCLG